MLLAHFKLDSELWIDGSNLGASMSCIYNKVKGWYESVAKIMHLRWKGKTNQKQYKFNQQIYVGYYSWIAKSVHINLIEELHMYAN